MKRIIQVTLITVLCLVVSGIKALADTVDIEAAETRIKAIVAFELNNLSLKGNPDAGEFNSSLNKLEKADSIGQILPAIQYFQKNVKFTMEIDSIDEKLTSKEELLDFYTGEIFKLDGVEKFLNNHETEADEVKTKIKNAITDYLNSIVIAGDKESSMDKSDSDASSTNENNNSADAKSDSILQDHASMIAIVAAVLFAIAALVLFFRTRSLQSVNNELKNKIEEKERHIMILEKEQEMVKRDAERKNREIRLLKENIESLESALALAKKKAESESQSAEKGRTAHIISTPIAYYVGSPRDGHFAGGSEVYRPGKSLFKITILNNNIGEFEFVQRPEAIQIAQQSKSTFLEPACNITNDVATFSQVLTVKNGKVERTDDGWKIICKADISLA